jgi:hypothetical protein
MSQFLWIEDFAGEPRNETKKVFGVLLQNAKIPNTKEAIKKFLSKYRVLVELTFLDGWQFIHNPQNLSKIDYIILDIDLIVEFDDDEDLPALLKLYGYEPDSDREQNQLSRRNAMAELQKVAGYQLYVELVMKLGFPEEHILFCSNHGDEIQKIKTTFASAKMPLPQILSKDEIVALADWITDKRQNAYMVLRRGIIEGCQQIGRLIEKHPELIQFGEFAKDENGAAVREVTVKDMQEYLETLANLLPLREPQELPRFYKLFLRTLTHEWDSAAPMSQKEDQVNFTFGWIMKNARNWSTHTTVLDELAAQDIAFLFMVAMRAMFKLGTAPQLYETYLLSLFEETPDLALKKVPLAATYSKVKRLLLKEERAADALHFNTMLNNMVNHQIHYDYVTGLFQIFWHGLAPVSSRLTKSNVYPRGEKASSEINYVYTFDTSHDFGKAEKGFLFKLACSIYQRSFPSPPVGTGL